MKSLPISADALRNDPILKNYLDIDEVKTALSDGKLDRADAKALGTAVSIAVSSADYVSGANKAALVKKALALREIYDLSLGASLRTPEVRENLNRLIGPTARLNIEVIALEQQDIQGQLEERAAGTKPNAKIQNRLVALRKSAFSMWEKGTKALHDNGVKTIPNLEKLLKEPGMELRAEDSALFVFALLEGRLSNTSTLKRSNKGTGYRDAKITIPKAALDTIEKVLERTPQSEYDELARLLLLSGKGGLGHILRGPKRPSNTALLAAKVQEYLIFSRPPADLKVEYIYDAIDQTPTFLSNLPWERRAHIVARILNGAVGERFESVDGRGPALLLADVVEQTPPDQRLNLALTLMPYMALIADHPDLKVGKERIFTEMESIWPLARKEMLRAVGTGYRHTALPDTVPPDSLARLAYSLVSDWVFMQGGNQGLTLKFERAGDPKSPFTISFTQWPQGEEVLVTRIDPADIKGPRKKAPRLFDYVQAISTPVRNKLFNAEEQKALRQGIPVSLANTGAASNGRAELLTSWNFTPAVEGRAATVRVDPAVLKPLVFMKYKGPQPEKGQEFVAKLKHQLRVSDVPTALMDSIAVNSGQITMDVRLAELLQQQKIFRLAMRSVRFTPEPGARRGWDPVTHSFTATEAGARTGNAVFFDGDADDSWQLKERTVGGNGFEYATFAGTRHNSIRWVGDAKTGSSQFVLPALAYTRFASMTVKKGDGLSEKEKGGGRVTNLDKLGKRDKDGRLDTQALKVAVQRYIHNSLSQPGKVTVIKNQTFPTTSADGKRGEGKTDFIAVSPAHALRMLDGNRLRLNRDRGADEGVNKDTLIERAYYSYLDHGSARTMLSMIPDVNQYSVETIDTDKEELSGNGLGGLKTTVYSSSPPAAFGSKKPSTEYFVDARGTASIGDALTDMFFVGKKIDFNKEIPIDHNTNISLRKAMGFDPISDLPSLLKPDHWPNADVEKRLKARFGEDFDFQALRSLLVNTEMATGFSASSFEGVMRTAHSLQRAYALDNLSQKYGWSEAETTRQLELWLEPGMSEGELLPAGHDWYRKDVRPEDLPPLNYAGHSKGGAEIHNLSVLLTLMGFRFNRMVTIGEPPNFNGVGVQLSRLLGLSTRTLRTRNGMDVVSKLGPGKSHDGIGLSILAIEGDGVRYNLSGEEIADRAKSTLFEALGSHSSSLYTNHAERVRRSSYAIPDDVLPTRIADDLRGDLKPADLRAFVSATLEENPGARKWFQNQGTLTALQKITIEDSTSDADSAALTFNSLLLEALTRHEHDDGGVISFNDTYNLKASFDHTLRQLEGSSPGKAMEEQGRYRAQASQLFDAVYLTAFSELDVPFWPIDKTMPWSEPSMRRIARLEAYILSGDQAALSQRVHHATEFLKMTDGRLQTSNSTKHVLQQRAARIRLEELTKALAK